MTFSVDGKPAICFYDNLEARRGRVELAKVELVSLN